MNVGRKVVARFVWSSASRDAEALAHCYFRGALGSSRVCDPHVTLGSAEHSLAEQAAPTKKCVECKRLLMAACV